MASEPRIHVLPDLLIKKIAAGEIVERPASVVKELVENAIDAGATRISVAIEDGGKQLIRVTDDGYGMSPAELTLSVAPHATSKIAAEDDLFAISTLGFRGEALASISSVSRLRIVSRPADSIEGAEVRMEGDHLEACQAAGCPPGTTIEVRDLFFNVPARRKFLKARSTEVGHINEQLSRLSLAKPNIGFELTNNGRTTLNVPAAATMLERIAKCYSAELASDLLCISRDERNLRIDAYAAPPARSRATAQWQYLFVNGRYVRDRFVQHAIKEAYRGLMEPNRHAVIFLFLTIDPRNVDVNVHPTKIEVRWADSNLIHSQVLSALREAFQQADLSPVLRTNRAAQPIDPAKQDEIRREMAEMLKATPPIQSGVHADVGAGVAGTASSTGLGRTSTAPLDVGEGEQIWQRLYGNRSIVPGSGGGEPSDALSRGVTDDPRMSEAASPPLSEHVIKPRAVQMHNLYLVVETEDGIVIVDQHALHERVIYEQLRARMTVGALEAQRLLLPESLTVTARQAALLEANGPLLERLGIEVSPFGADSVAIHTFPALLKDTDVAPFMRDLLDRLAQQSGETSSDEVVNDVLSMMACKAAVKAGDSLTPDEIDALVSQRHLTDKSTSCPHGRPTMLRFTKADLNRQFKRT